MDPVNRRSVWKLIRELKQNRIVILTTHSMEEADALGDSIAILATGRLRAIGSPLFLKNRFGAGYSLNIIAAPERMQELRDMVHTHLPGAEIVFGGVDEWGVTVCMALEWCCDTLDCDVMSS